MSTVAPLLSSAAFVVWSVGSLALVGGWCALAFTAPRRRRARRSRKVPPFVV